MKHRSAAFSSQRALVALLVSVLQLAGVFHLALVPHAYSAAGGGLMHVHRAPRPSPGPSASSHAGAHAESTILSRGSASSLAELCPLADAPQSSPPRIAYLPSGWVAYGPSEPMREPARPSPEPLLQLLRAPKTSPPV